MHLLAHGAFWCWCELSPALHMGCVLMYRLALGAFCPPIDGVVSSQEVES